MNEKELAQKITRTLDWGTSQMDGENSPSYEARVRRR
jgi:hypothetical protein